MLHFYQVSGRGEQNLEEAHCERGTVSACSGLGCESNDADACRIFSVCFLETLEHFERKFAVPVLCLAIHIAFQSGWHGRYGGIGSSWHGTWTLTFLSVLTAGQHS